MAQSVLMNGRRISTYGGSRTWAYLAHTW